MSKNKEDGKYLSFKIVERRRSGEVIILQACLVNKARLKLAISRNPMPPSNFGRHKRAQDNLDIPLEIFEPHQKRRIIFSTSSKIELGNLKQDITNVGIAYNTYFTNTSLPAIDKFFSFQPRTRNHNLSFR